MIIKVLGQKKIIKKMFDDNTAQKHLVCNTQTASKEYYCN